MSTEKFVQVRSKLDILLWATVQTRDFPLGITCNDDVRNRRTCVAAGYFMRLSTMIHDDGDDDAATGINNLCTRLDFEVSLCER